MCSPVFIIQQGLHSKIFYSGGNAEKWKRNATGISCSLVSMITGSVVYLFSILESCKIVFLYLALSARDSDITGYDKA